MCRVTQGDVGAMAGLQWTKERGAIDMVGGIAKVKFIEPYTKASLWVFSKHAGKAIESFACGADITGSVLRRHQENCLKEGRE